MRKAQGILTNESLAMFIVIVVAAVIGVILFVIAKRVLGLSL